MMKTCTTIVILLAALGCSRFGRAQTVDSPYEIGVWRGFRTAAVSFTFDDGTANQFSKAVPLFNEFGFNLTLFTVTRSIEYGLPNWDVLQNTAAQGHEIAAHTLTHTSFAGMSDSLQTLELRDCQSDIDSHISGQKCVTMAYAFCVTGNKSLCAQYYIAARICSGVIEPRTPRDFMAISSIICGTEGSVKTADHFISRFTSTVKSGGWCVLLLHGVDDDGGWSPVPSSTLRETLEYLHANPNDYWIETFGNVARYIKERDAASVAEIAATDTDITVRVTDGLDDAIYNYPVTLRRPLPDGWASATVEQNGQPVAVQVAEGDSVSFIMFDALPDAGDVILTKNGSAGVRTDDQAITASVLRQNYPNPFNPVTTIPFELTKAGWVRLTVFDLRGREVTTLLNEELASGRHSITFTAETVASGVYVCTLQGEGVLQQRKMVLLR
ncbi:polysaccharide deacetylase family protein [candidate division KSB1 bacterium]|nr:polysaccharide deacetylase family protein [candidate division KSB1 bacterium]